MDKSKPKLTQRLKEKYRINVLNPENFQELSTFTVNWLQIIMVISTIAVVSFSLCLALIVYTPLNRYFQATTAESFSRRDVAQIMTVLDSIDRATNAQEKYSQNFRAVLTGNDTASAVGEVENAGSAEQPSENELFYISPTDSALRRELESKKLDLAEGATINSSIHFYPPVDGYIADSFNAATKHYAVDIVATEDDAVKSVQDGVVIFSDFTSSTGHVMMIQHNHGYVSVYKHNAVLLKSVGSFVRAGETIGIVGNSGELTSGKHLHFELWLKGQALNPSEYINF